MVVGHTDDQRDQVADGSTTTTSCRARARVSVANVLKGAIDNPARLHRRGVGSSEPRYRPESDPENRARNRRVEIIHFAGI